jgi:hypothetical protein
VHALDLARLRQPGISFWTAWVDDVLVGCGALKELDPTHGEIKSIAHAASASPFAAPGARMLATHPGGRPLRASTSD